MQKDAKRRQKGGKKRAGAAEYGLQTLAQEGLTEQFSDYVLN